MSQHHLAPDVLSGGTLVITIAWYDDTDTAVTPNSASYTLRKALTGEVVNSILDTAIAVPANTNDIVLSGNSLPAGVLKLYVTALYNSTSGTGLPLKSIIEFPVREFI